MNIQPTPSNKNKELTITNEEAEIRRILDDFHQAVVARDLDKIMSFYAPEVVAFDIAGALQFVGLRAYRKSWEKAFLDIGTGSTYEIHHLQVTAGEDVAFCFGLNHWIGKTKDGHPMDMWMRFTNCFKKINGMWLITHEQFSVPLEFETGKALMDLKPGPILH